MTVSIDEERLRRVAEVLGGLESCAPADWTYEGLPAVGDPHAIDYFFTGTKHQYGFWGDDGRAYTEPMYATVEGTRLKGSDFIWHSLRRAARRDASLYDLDTQAGMSDEQIAAVFSDDEGRCPLPMLETHCRLWRRYARDLLDAGLTPKEIVKRCRKSEDPAALFMDLLSRVGGYGEDPLAKKAALLLVIIANRPERFLGAPEDRPGRKPFAFPPIVDYHNMRSVLRMGIVRIGDPDLERRIRERQLVSAEEESAIRRKVFEALLELVEASGKGIESIDWFFFRNRTRCPEMTEPGCRDCEVNAACARRTELFQPVFRTTFY